MRDFDKIIDEDFAKELNKKEVGVERKTYKKDGLEICQAVLDKNNALGRFGGEYLTITMPNFLDASIKSCVKILSKTARRFICGAKRILIVGMGNEFILSDSLGIMVIRSLDLEFFSKSVTVSKFCPSVASNSGIDSFALVDAVVKLFKPDCVIVIDSLCTSNEERIGRSFQVTNAGIVPGSAVGNFNCTLTSDSLGAPVVAIGVPMVVDLMSVILREHKKIKPLSPEDLKAVSDKFSGEIYMPKDIDFLLENSSRIVSKAIISAINYLI